MDSSTGAERVSTRPCMQLERLFSASEKPGGWKAMEIDEHIRARAPVIPRRRRLSSRERRNGRSRASLQPQKDISLFFLTFPVDIDTRIFDSTLRRDHIDCARCKRLLLCIFSKCTLFCRTSGQFMTQRTWFIRFRRT